MSRRRYQRTHHGSDGASAVTADPEIDLADMINQLAGVLPEDEMLEVIRRTESCTNHADAVVILTAKLQDAGLDTGDTDAGAAAGSDAELLAVHHLRIVERIVTLPAPRDRRTLGPVQIGWMIARDTPAGTLYAGKTLSWGPESYVVPFQTSQEATTAAVYHARTLEMAGSVNLVDTREVSMKVVITSDLVQRDHDQSFSVRLNPRHSSILQSVLRAARARNIEVGGRPVASSPEAIRYLVDCVGKSLESRQPS